MKKGTCKHYNGKIFLNKAPCDKGINVRELVGGEVQGWFNRCPCMKRHETEIACSSYEDPTDAEIEAEEQDWARVMDKIVLAMPLVAKLKGENPNGGSGVAQCPACSGKFRYSISSYNKHMHAICDTTGCISFME